MNLVERVLRVPLLAKLAGANILIVLAALVGVAIERRVSFPSNVVPILGIALAASLVVNLVLVYVALRPLSDLERTATLLAAGDIEARVPDSILADRDMARVGTMLNDLLDRLAEDRARERRLAAQVISAQDEERARVARELHDSTAQTLTAVMLQLGAAAHEVRRQSSTPASRRCANWHRMRSSKVRSMSCPHAPARARRSPGDKPALEWLARRTTGAGDARCAGRRRGIRPADSGTARSRAVSRGTGDAAECLRDMPKLGMWTWSPSARWLNSGVFPRSSMMAVASTSNAQRRGVPGWDFFPCVSG